MRTINKIVVDLLSNNQLTSDEAEMLLNNNQQHCTYPSCYCNKPEWTNYGPTNPYWTITSTNNNNENS